MWFFLIRTEARLGGRRCKWNTFKLGFIFSQDFHLKSESTSVTANLWQCDSSSVFWAKASAWFLWILTGNKGGRSWVLSDQKQRIKTLPAMKRSRRLEPQGHLYLGSWEACNKGERVIAARDGPHSYRILWSHSFVLTSALEILPLMMWNLKAGLFQLQKLSSRLGVAPFLFLWI